MIVPGIDAQFQEDLVDVQNLSRFNKGYKYLLTCIDIFSKHAWVVPLKTKQGQELVKAFQTILSSGRKPNKLQTDQGTEFLNHVFQKFLRENNIDFFTVNSLLKASVVERFNRTFKNKMYKYFTAKNTLTYIDVLPKLVKSYNNTYHRGIKMKPSQVTKSNEATVWDTLYGNDVDKRMRYKFQVGNRVRISKVKRMFEKSYLPNFTEEMFTIYKRFVRQVPVYKLTISLSGDWEVALTEIHYPHSWNNVQGNVENRFYLRDQELDGMWEPLIVPPGHYPSVADLLTKINEVINANDRFKDELQLSFDTLNRKVTVHSQNKVEMYFSNIGQMLGFSPNNVISSTSTAERAVDLKHSFHDLYVYCDIIQSQYVGDALVPLLRNPTRRREGWGENQQVIYSPTILICQQKAI